MHTCTQARTIKAPKRLTTFPHPASHRGTGGGRVTRACARVQRVTTSIAGHFMQMALYHCMRLYAKPLVADQLCGADFAAHPPGTMPATALCAQNCIANRRAASALVAEITRRPFKKGAGDSAFYSQIDERGRCVCNGCLGTDVVCHDHLAPPQAVVNPGLHRRLNKHSVLGALRRPNAHTRMHACGLCAYKDKHQWLMGRHQVP